MRRACRTNCRENTTLIGAATSEFGDDTAAMDAVAIKRLADCEFGQAHGL